MKKRFAKTQTGVILTLATVTIFGFLLMGAGIKEGIKTQFVEDYGTDYGARLVMNFEEGQGTTAFDQSPYGNDGEIDGATWTNGKYGEALSFDGGDFVIINDSSSLDISSQITIEAWGKDPPLPYGVELGGDFEIINNAVVVDDDRVYLSAEPHTITSSGWVEFNFISKKFGGNIDVVFGFNISEVTPKKPQIWTEKGVREYRWIKVNSTDEIIVNNITGYLNLGNDYNGTLDIGNEWNIRFFLINGTIHNDTRTWIIGFTDWDITEYPDFVLIKYLYTNWEKEYYYVDGFAEWNPNYNVINREFKGMNKWFVLSSVNIVSNKNYKIRIWIELPFAGNDIVKGKYAWGIKLSSDTIQQAIENNRFYFIDPWFVSSWLYRMKIFVDSGDIDEDLINFPVMVYLNSSRINWNHVQDDLDDIRFVWGEEISTILDYELENYVINDEAWFWVEILYVFNYSDTEFYMYYGNIGATNGEDKAGTWENNFVMVQHMVDETTSTILDSTQYDNDGAKEGANEPIETANGRPDSAQDFDGTNDDITIADSASLNITEAITVSAWVKTTDRFGHKIVVGDLGVVPTSGYEVAISDNKLRFLIWNQAGALFGDLTGTSIITDGTWYYLTVTYDRVNMRVYVDGVLDKAPVAENQAIGIGPDPYYIGARLGVSSFFNDTLDEVRVSNVTRSVAWIKASYESERDDLLSFSFEIRYHKIIVRKQFAYSLGIENTDTLIGMINEVESTYLIDNVTAWHYYAMSFDCAYIRLYIDGVLVNTTACVGPIDINNEDLYIGDKFLGEIDQVRIYKVAKTLGEIRNHYLNSGHIYSGSVIVSDNFRILNSSLDEMISVKDEGLDMNLNYILYSPFESWLHAMFSPGATNVEISSIPSGIHYQDRHYSQLHVSVDTAPGVDKFVNVTLSDGINFMNISLTGAETSESTTIGAFDLDVSVEGLILIYSQTAGGASEEACIMIHWYYKENE